MCVCVCNFNMLISTPDRPIPKDRPIMFLDLSTAPLPSGGS